LRISIRLQMLEEGNLVMQGFSKAP
jgi:hypothetical protein